MKSPFFASTAVISIVLWLAGSSAFAETRPNVVMILTDDQGYGDMSCMVIHGYERPTWTDSSPRVCDWKIITLTCLLYANPRGIDDRSLFVALELGL